MLEPPLDRVKDVHDGSIGVMLDPDVHLLAIAEKRDALRADDESQPLGKCASARGVRYHDPHFHPDPPSARAPGP